jgi:plasmid stability protein
MSAITIHLPDATAEKLREQASHQGKSLESHIQHIVEQAALIPEDQQTIADLDVALGALCANLPPLPRLPESMSRADHYDEHD